MRLDHQRILDRADDPTRLWMVRAAQTEHLSEVFPRPRIGPQVLPLDAERAPTQGRGACVRALSAFCRHPTSKRYSPGERPPAPDNRSRQVPQVGQSHTAVNVIR